MAIGLLDSYAHGNELSFFNPANMETSLPASDELEDRVQAEHENEGPQSNYHAMVHKMQYEPIQPVNSQGKTLSWVAQHIRNRQNQKLGSHTQPAHLGSLNMLIDRRNKEFIYKA